MKIKMMSLDTSSTATGWAYWEGYELKEHDVIDLKKFKENKHQRMTEMIWVLLNNYTPDVIVLENTSVLTNAQTQRILTMIIGTVYTWCVIFKKDYHALRPSEWRSKIKNETEKVPRKRAELKLWSISKVQELFKIETTDDGADAILIGQAYLNLFNKEK